MVERDSSNGSAATQQTAEGPADSSLVLRPGEVPSTAYPGRVARVIPEARPRRLTVDRVTAQGSHSRRVLMSRHLSPS